jgi:hypothetical protein
MKKLILTSSVALFALFVSAQTTTTTAPTQTPDNPNGPEIKFDNIVHDYGTLQKGADGKCEFKFTNTGKEPLILSNVQSSCGCTIPSWSKEPILPGKSGVINVNYTKTNVVGTISKQITVFSNAKSGNVVLNIKGSVVDNTTPTIPEKPDNKTTVPVIPIVPQR